MTPSGECRTPAPRWLLAAGSGGVVALQLVTLWGLWDGSSPALRTVDVLAAVAGCGLLPLLAWRPVPVAVVLAALAAVSPVATAPSTAATFSIAQRRRPAVAGAVALAGIAGHALRWTWRPDRGPFPLWLGIVVAVHAGLLGWGAWLRARNELVAVLRERADRAEAEQGRRVAEARAAERARIAREMHDVLAHRLSLLATYAGALEYRPDAPPEQLARAAGVVRSGVHTALEELREVIVLLRDDDGAEPPGARLAAVPDLVAETRASGTAVDLQDRLPSGPGDPPPASGRAAYRIVQEALTNARRHAPGRPVVVVLGGGPGEGLSVDVRNRVAGPPAPRSGAAVGSGTGLVGLTERARLAGGRMDHRTTPAGEFVVSAWLPWPA